MKTVAIILRIMIITLGVIGISVSAFNLSLKNISFSMSIIFMCLFLWQATAQIFNPENKPSILKQQKVYALCCAVMLLVAQLLK